MCIIKENYSLQDHNTFGISAKAKYFATFNSEEKLADLLKSEITQKEPLFILGGGSNILLTKNNIMGFSENPIKLIRFSEENEYQPPRKIIKLLNKYRIADPDQDRICPPLRLWK